MSTLAISSSSQHCCECLSKLLTNSKLEPLDLFKLISELKLQAVREVFTIELEKYCFNSQFSQHVSQNTLKKLVTCSNDVTMLIINKESYEILLDILRVHLRQSNNCSEYIQISQLYNLSQRIGVNIMGDIVVPIESNRNSFHIFGSNNNNLLNQITNLQRNVSYFNHITLHQSLIEHEAWSNHLLWLDCCDRLLQKDLKSIATLRLTGTIPIIEEFFHINIDNIAYILLINRIQQIARVLPMYASIKTSLLTDYIKGAILLYNMPLYVHKSSHTVEYLLANMYMKVEYCLWLLDVCCKLYECNILYDSQYMVYTSNNNTYDNVYSTGYNPIQNMLLAICKSLQKVQYNPSVRHQHLHTAATSVTMDSERHSEGRNNNNNTSHQRRASGGLSIPDVSSFFHRRASSTGNTNTTTAAGSVSTSIETKVCICCRRMMSTYDSTMNLESAGIGINNTYVSCAKSCTMWSVLNDTVIAGGNELHSYRSRMYNQIVCEYCYRIILATCAPVPSSEYSTGHILCTGTCVIPIPKVEFDYYTTNESEEEEEGDINEGSVTSEQSSDIADYVYVEDRFTYDKIYADNTNNNNSNISGNTQTVGNNTSIHTRPCVDPEALLHYCIQDILHSYNITISTPGQSQGYHHPTFSQESQKNILPSHTTNSNSNSNSNSNFQLDNDILELSMISIGSSSEDPSYTTSHSNSNNNNETYYTAQESISPNVSSPPQINTSILSASTTNNTNTTTNNTTAMYTAKSSNVYIGNTTSNGTPGIIYDSFYKTITTTGIAIYKANHDNFRRLQSRQLHYDNNDQILYWTETKSRFSFLLTNHNNTEELSSHSHIYDPAHSCKANELESFSIGVNEMNHYIQIKMNNKRKRLVIYIKDQVMHDCFLQLLRLLIKK